MQPTPTLRQLVHDVGDLDAAVARYRDAFGLTVAVHDPSGWAVLHGDHLELALAADDQRVGATATMTCRVEHLSTAIAELERVGFSAAGPATSGHHERWIRCEDPDGLALLVYERAS